MLSNFSLSFTLCCCSVLFKHRSYAFLLERYFERDAWSKGLACNSFFATLSLLFWARQSLSYQGCLREAPPLGFCFILVLLTVTFADLKMIFVRFVTTSLTDRGKLLAVVCTDKLASKTFGTF